MIFQAAQGFCFWLGHIVIFVAPCSLRLPVLDFDDCSEPIIVLFIVYDSFKIKLSRHFSPGLSYLVLQSQTH